MTIERLRSLLRVTVLLCVATIIAACGSTPAPIIDTSGGEESATFDGLFPVRNSGADEAWARPDIDLSIYRRVRFVGAGVQYRPGGETSRSMRARSRSDTFFEISPEGREAFEQIVAGAFLEQLEASEVFELVEEDGPDVLLVRGALLDVVSFVPPESVGRTEVFLRSVGEATLMLELRDSMSNTVLARSVDRRAAESPGGGRGDLNWSNPVSNSQEVRRLARRWATSLREGLEQFMSGEQSL